MRVVLRTKNNGNLKRRLNVKVYTSVLTSLLNKVDIHTLCSFIVHVTSCLGIKIDISKF